MSKEKVLIVDDERDVLELCRRVLESQGYETKIASNGFEAVEIACQERHYELCRAQYDECVSGCQAVWIGRLIEGPTLIPSAERHLRINL